MRPIRIPGPAWLDTFSGIVVGLVMGVVGCAIAYVLHLGTLGAAAFGTVGLVSGVFAFSKLTR